MLPRGVDSAGGAVGGLDVRGGPARELELGVAGVVAAADVVALLAQHLPVASHQDRPERLIPRLQRLTRQLHAAPQMHPVDVAEGHAQTLNGASRAETEM